MFFAGTLAVSALFAAPLSAQVNECLKQAGNPQRPPMIVKFDVDSTAIQQADRQELQDFASRMRGNPGAIICVIGQADKQGDEDYNRDLARRRAEAVGQLLLTHGVRQARMTVAVRGEAFGDDVLGFIAPFDTDRRVEVLRWDPTQEK
ncbi:MAG: OmpA family protein [Rhodovibrionaceae bacterium]